MSIHPTAIVDSTARIGSGVEIGPYCIVERDVVLGDDCHLATRAIIKQGTELGPRNTVHEDAILGGLPQHSNLPERIGRLKVGKDNTFRENITVHRGLHHDEYTEIGDNNLVMVGVHIGHDCVIGNNTVLINNVMLAGHVTVGDRAYVAGGAAVQQFRRVGRLAAVGGYSRAVKDVPPFVTLDGNTSGVVGLNRVGLQRAGYGAEDLRDLKSAYRLIYRSGLAWNEILKRLENEFTKGPAAEFYSFFAGGKYGFMPERRTPNSATIRLYRADGAADDARDTQAKAG
ncbi:MAG: acyl-[acyl-carrier-protein]--UDP-N-acetylglucosamine O-acyltransferase [Planctomycetaceae bacterium]|nr:acyl-[acyl-carrier-protein]--UDP-N-acetylglucosamine O-acyltransferase [Planctomycetaceae bacterium]